AEVRVVLVAADPELRTQLATDRLGCDDHSGLDHDLVDRAVDHRDQFPHLGDLAWGIADHEGVGALVRDQAATRRQEAGVALATGTTARTTTATTTGATHALGFGKGFVDLGGVVIVDLDVLGRQLDPVRHRDP